MAECLSAQNKYGLSVSYFDRVISAKKASMEQKRKAYYGLGYAQYNREQYEMAYQNFSLFMNLNTSKNHIYLNDAALKSGRLFVYLKTV